MNSQEVNRGHRKEGYEKVIQIDRISRTVKGGRRIRFRALVVIGDLKGTVAIGVAKANDVSQAITKATASAKKHRQSIKIVNDTIPHDILQTYGSARIYFKPAPKGSSLIAGGTVRSIVEAAGIKNIVAKSLGSANKINVAKATMLALTSF